MPRRRKSCNACGARTTHAEQRLEVELTNKSHAQRALQAIAQRRERLREETGGQDAPDALDLAEKEEELSLLREELAGDQDHLQQLQQELPQLEATESRCRATLQRIERELAAGQARRAALEQMQARMQPERQVARMAAPSRTGKCTSTLAADSCRCRLGIGRRSRLARTAQGHRLRRPGEAGRMAA
jgi:chromosome segregation ATPase